MDSLKMALNNKFTTFLLLTIFHMLNFLFVFIASVAAGFINAIAGGGTLITFPVLTAIGIPPVAANVTNTIGLVSGVLGGVYSQRHDFETQKKRLVKILPVSIVGGVVGGLILLHTRESSFRAIIPFLILSKGEYMICHSIFVTRTFSLISSEKKSLVSS